MKNEEFPAFQKTVAHFVKANELEIPVQFRLLDLVSEIGELAKEVLKGTSYGHEPFQKADTWTEELGDALFSLICVANSTGVDLEMALDVILKKYGERLRSKGELGSG